MPQFTKRLSAWILRRRPVTPTEFAEIADWVNEGGALDPAGPPPVIDPESEDTGGQASAT